MKEPRLNISDIGNIEAVDILDLVEIWEGSLNIHFSKNELQRVDSFRELISLIINKSDLENSNTSTHTLTFNKIIKVFSEIGISSKKEISPSTPLKDLMPWTKRKWIEKVFQDRLSSKINLISVSCSSILVWLLIAFISIIGLFFVPKLACFGLIVSIIIIALTIKFSRSLIYMNIEALIEELMCCDYLNMRGNNTINRDELYLLIKKSFADSLDLEEYDFEIKKL